MGMTNFDVEFTKDGAVFDQTQVDALIAGLAPVTDLFVLSHGWNNDKADANALYDELVGNIDKLLDLRECSQRCPTTLRGLHHRLRGREFAAVRIYWPSKKFTDAELIPGGGAATAQAEQENIAAVEKVLDGLKEDPERLGDHTQDPDRAKAMESAKALASAAGDRRRPEGVRQAAASDAGSGDGREG